MGIYFPQVEARLMRPSMALTGECLYYPNRSSLHFRPFIKLNYMQQASDAKSPHGFFQFDRPFPPRLWPSVTGDQRQCVDAFSQALAFSLDH
jgi:hypothetical protein